MKPVIIHIGIHKTGSTSIQMFLLHHARRLKALHFDFYRGRHVPQNHVELHMAAMRDERMSPFKYRMACLGQFVDEDYRRSVRESIHAHHAQSGGDGLVYSAEGLSLLCHEDEGRRLRQLFPNPDALEFRIVMYVRDKKKWLDSYRLELKKHVLPRVITRDSYACVDDDTWLLDYHSRQEMYAHVFGRENVRVLDYDREMARHGNILPSFLDVLGIKNRFTPDEHERYRFNKSPKQQELVGELSEAKPKPPLST